MATQSEYLAAAERAKAAGDAAAEARLRAKASAAEVTPDRYRAAAERAKAAGDQPAFERLTAKAVSLEDAAARNPAGGPMLPPRADAPQDAPRAPKDDPFGDTAASMAAPPIAAARRFAGGLTGGASPSREYLANDPLTRALPGPVLTGLGYVGDAAGAALMGAGAGVAGAAGVAAELVPGQNAAREEKLAGELLTMGQFAVPELAGASSVPVKVGSAAISAAPKAPVASLADDVAAARARGIPVYRTDVSPPKTFIGRNAQRIGEAVPIAGMGGPRAAQNVKRIEAAKAFVSEYGADIPDAAIDDVAASLISNRAKTVKNLAKAKTGVIKSVDGKGPVPTPNATAAIDAQIVALRQQKMAGLEPVIAKLEDFKASLQNQPLSVIEQNRKVIGEAFKGMESGSVRTVGEKALSAVYDPLRKDMGDFIGANGGPEALARWSDANKRLSGMIDETRGTVLKRVLAKGEATPEVVASMLFTGKPSDIARLYRGLDDTGRARARTAIVQHALGKAGGIEAMSPEKFKAALGNLGPQVKVFFRGADFEAVTGLQRALKLTERAGAAAASPPTGVQAMPAVIGAALADFLGGFGSAVTSAGTIGLAARAYENTGVQAALRAMAKAQTPKAEAVALRRLAVAVQRAAPAVATSAQAAGAEARAAGMR